MRVKILKRTYLKEYGIWMPYFIIRCANITPEEYSQIHATSEYAQYPYIILD